MRTQYPVILLIALCLFASPHAHAHDPGLSSLDAHLRATGLDLELRLRSVSLPEGVDPGAWLGPDSVRVFDGEAAIEPLAWNVRASEPGHLVVRARYARPQGEARIEAPVLTRLARGHRQYARVFAGGELAAERLLSADATGLDFDGSTSPVASEFLALGTEHIVFGADHLVFLGVLLIGAPRPRKFAAAATVFALAHSSTLVLGALGFVSAPAGPVEIAIALSIAGVALARTLRPDAPPEPLWLVFACGAVHGLGFAGAAEPLLAGAPSLLPLLAFNLGIEAGQLAVGAPALALWSLISRSRSATRLRRLFACGAGGAGVWWLVQRIALAF